jgi:hypothetical protein
VLVDVVAVCAVQVAVVKIVDVAVVSDRGVSAAGAVLVVVIGMRLMIHVGSSPQSENGVNATLARIATRLHRRTWNGASSVLGISRPPMARE